MLPALIAFTMSLLVGYFVFHLISLFIRPRTRLIIQIPAMLILGYICYNVIFLSDLVNISYGLAAFLLLTMVCFKGSAISRISIVVLFYPIMTAVSIICTEGMKTRFTIPVTFLFWLTVYLLFKNRLSNCINQLTDRMWLLMDIICTAAFFMTFLVVLKMETGEVAVIILGSCTTIITNTGVLVLIIAVIKSLKAQSDLKQLQMQATYYDILDQEHQNTRKIRHDMNNHMQVVDGLLNETQYEKAHAYIESVFSSLNHSVLKNYAGDPVINLVLNQKIKAMEDHHISVDAKISLEKLESFRDMDLCCILSNTLDNALEACKKIPDKSNRRIEIKARIKNGYFSYALINSKTNATTTKNGKFITDKADKKQHGFGISNVKEIVAKYKGEIDFKDLGKTFEVVMIIPLSSVS